MSQFTYRAVDRKGVARDGVREAGNRDDVVSWLSGEGLIPVEVRSGGRSLPAWLTQPLLARRAVSSAQLLKITIQLAALLRAELNLDRALSIVRRLTEHRASRAMLDRLLEKVRAGSSFADALAQQSDIPGHYVSMVRAGEASGALPESLARVAEFLQRREETRTKIRSALVYPAILSFTVLITLLVIVIVVLPRFDALFTASEAPVPLATRLVLGFGKGVRSYGWLVGAGVLLMSLYAWSRWRDGPSRARLDAFLLRTRWTFGLPRNLESSRYLRTVATLCTGGLSLPSSLRIAQQGIGNRAFKEAAAAVSLGIKEGQSLSPLLDEAKVYPALAVQLARVGEETGRLPHMLMQAADMLDVDAQTTIGRLLNLMVPVITLAMGTLVALLIGSVLAGILSVNDLAF